MYYLVHDREQIQKFALEVLDMNHLPRNHSHMLCVIARTKYDPSISFRKGFFRRQLAIAPDVDMFLRMVLSYEVHQGLYIDDQNQPLKERALALYCSINPRDQLKSLRMIAKQAVDLLAQQHTTCPISLSKSILQRTCAQKRWYVLNLNHKESLPELQAALSQHKIPVSYVIATHSGYHLLLSTALLGRVQRKLLQTVIRPQFSLDDGEDLYVPIPGTLQGGFPVHFV